MVGAATGLGFIFGPMISGITLTIFNGSYRAPAYVAAGFAATSLMLTVLRLPETRPSAANPDRPTFWASLYAGVRSKDLGPLFRLVFAVQFLFASLTAVFSLFTLNRLGFDSVDNAIFFTIFGLLLVVMQGVVVGKAVTRFGHQRVLIISFAIATLGFAGAALTPQQPVPWFDRADMITELTQVDEVGAALDLIPPANQTGTFALVLLITTIVPAAIGYSLQLPTLNALIANSVDDARMGEALGISAAFLGLGSVLAPLWAGYIFDRINPGAPFAANAAISCFVLFAVIRNSNNQTTKAQPN